MPCGCGQTDPPYRQVPTQRPAQPAPPSTNDAGAPKPRPGSQGERGRADAARAGSFRLVLTSGRVQSFGSRLEAEAARVRAADPGGRIEEG